jgi:transcriptional regulator with XRE-family HTH domain
MTVGKRIQKIRKEKGLTQKELGAKLGVSASMIGQYENDLRKPKMETIRKIATALNVDESALLTVNLAIHTSVQNASFPFLLIQEYREVLDNILKSGHLPYEFAEKIKDTLPSDNDIKFVFNDLAELGTEAAKGSMVNFNFIRLSASEREFINDLIEFLIERKKRNDNASE